MKTARNSKPTHGYAFHEGTLPTGYHFVFAEAVFNRSAYRFLQVADGWCSYYILHPQTMSVHGQVHFHVRERVAVSPLRAPFGSIEMSPHVSAEVLADFLEFTESRLVKAGVLKVFIKNPPDAYQPVAARILNTLFLNKKYTIASEETTSIIFVSPTPFSEVIHPRKGRRLKQSRCAPFLFSRLDQNSLPDVYEFISSCRTPKKYELSTTFDELQRTVEQFPDEYHIFAVSHQDQLVAASVAIALNDKVLYHFISDHVRTIASFSPALVLMEGIYNFCYRHDLQMFDLGTSGLAGMPNTSLLNFKKELGAKAVCKFTFTKPLG